MRNIVYLIAIHKKKYSHAGCREPDRWMERKKSFTKE
jgi:hypothetical protein